MSSLVLLASCVPGQVKVKVKVSQSCPTLCDHGLFSPWNSLGQKKWSGQPLPSPGDLSNPGIKPRSPALQAASSPAEPQGKPKRWTVMAAAADLSLEEQRLCIWLASCYAPRSEWLTPLHLSSLSLNVLFWETSPDSLLTYTGPSGWFSVLPAVSFHCIYHSL